jgi:hypothetical protein
MGIDGNIGNTGVPWTIALAAALPLGLIAFGALIWYWRASLVRAIFGLMPRHVRATAIALLLALATVPLVALTCGATDGTNKMGPATEAARWTAAASAVLLSALFAGTIGAPIVRRNSGGGACLTVVIALLVAIPTSTWIPSLLGQSVGLGEVCFLSSCTPAVATAPYGSGPAISLFFVLTPFVEPVPFVALAIGVGVWTVGVRRLTMTETRSAANPPA